MSVITKSSAIINSSKCQKFIRVFGTIMIIMMMLLSIACAEGSVTIEEGIKDGTSQLWNLMTAIVIPVAAVVFAWNAFKVLFGGERGMEQAKKNMLTIVLVLALVFLAPFIVQEISGWFSQGSSGGVFD